MGYGLPPAGEPEPGYLNQGFPGAPLGPPPAYDHPPPAPMATVGARGGPDDLSPHPTEPIWRDGEEFKNSMSPFLCLNWILMFLKNVYYIWYWIPCGFIIQIKCALYYDMRMFFFFTLIFILSIECKSQLYTYMHVKKNCNSWSKLTIPKHMTILRYSL